MVQTIVIFSFVAFFVALSAFVKFFPPKKRNAVYGYRTTKSMSSDENWIKYNKIFGDLFFKYSLIDSISVFILFAIFGGHPLVILYTAISFSAAMIVVIVKTNKIP